MRVLILTIAVAGCAVHPSEQEPEAPQAPVEDVVSTELAAVEEADLLTLTNASRAAEGLPPLLPYWDLTDDARLQVAAMESAGFIYHNPDLASVVGVEWTRLGENVGVGGTAVGLHDAFMASPGHRANVLGDWDYVGVGADRDATGRLWVALVFMASPLAGLERYLPPFRDDEGNTHEAAIQAIYSAGITYGCNPPANDHYCPDDPVTRAQMAAFLTRAFALPPSTEDAFVDDDHHWAEANIQALAAAGITRGCGEGIYCPERSVSRAEMAAFLTRALALPSSSADVFVDDDDHWAEGDIQAIAAAGITRGCNPPARDRYCPGDPVTRAQMATFLTRALGL